MTILRFVKMEGAGNDYVFVDGIRNSFPIESGERLAPYLSNRHFGVGSDGLIAMLPSEVADCRMIMWNADGSRAEMCGNGIRCLAKLARDTGLVSGEQITVETDRGIRSIRLLLSADGAVQGAEVEMGPVTVEKRAETVTLGGRMYRFHAGDAGNPHAVIFTEGDPETEPVVEVGAMFQGLDRFPQGVNVEFAAVQPDGSLVQRTYERGSGETLACGSGATVAALAALETGRVPGPSVPVRLHGGVLIIHRRGTSLAMEGPARTVFIGETEIPDP